MRTQTNTLVFIIVIGVLYALYGYRYKLWHFAASSSWSDFEQREFKLLNDKYGKPGNPKTITTKGSFFINELGVWVSRPVQSANSK